MTDHGRVVWSELNTHDPETAKRFLADTIGWMPMPMPIPGGGTYWLMMMDDEPAAGLFVMTASMMVTIPEHWMTYIEMDDIDRRCERVAPAGGTVLRAPWTIPGVGRLAIVRTPGGAVMGWMTSDHAAD